MYMYMHVVNWQSKIPQNQLDVYVKQIRSKPVILNVYVNIFHVNNWSRHKMAVIQNGSSIYMHC